MGLLGERGMNVQLIDKMGSDLSVVNAARVSFAKRKEVIDEKDEKLSDSETDKYEEKNYEQTIKKNLANSISQKLILRLAVN